MLEHLRIAPECVGEINYNQFLWIKIQKFWISKLSVPSSFSPNPSKIIFMCGRGAISSPIVFFEIPFLAIPFPWAKDNHQFYNSKHLSDENLCWLMNQQDFQLTNTKNFLLNLMLNKDEFFLKKRNMEKFSYQNSWNDVNQKLINLINEN